MYNTFPPLKLMLDSQKHWVSSNMDSEKCYYSLFFCIKINKLFPRWTQINAKIYLWTKNMQTVSFWDSSQTKVMLHFSCHNTIIWLWVSSSKCPYTLPWLVMECLNVISYIMTLVYAIVRHRLAGWLCQSQTKSKPLQL